MKRQYILSILLVLCTIGAMAQKKEYSGRMHITPLVLEQKGDSLYLQLMVDMNGVNVKSNRSISLVPSLVAPNHRFDYPAVEVKGRTNYNVYNREMFLMSKRQVKAYSQTEPYSVLKGFKAKDSRAVKYNKVIKYEPWMADAKLEVYEDLCGCGNPPRRTEVTTLADHVTLEKPAVEPYTIIPYLAYIQPIVEAVKRREIIGEAFLDFMVNKVDIRPDYMNNPTELKKITDLISEVKNDKDITVRQINVVGYASPEGSLAGNQRLSEGRAKALADYLSAQFDFPRNIYKVAFGGENWAGLKEAVEKSDIAYKQQVLDIIASIPAEIDTRNNSSRKKALMDLRGGEPYRYMLKEFFPSLRKAICKIDFDVRGFDVAEAKEIAKTRPQNLSLNEMFLVAGTYEKGSQEFIDLFETAARIFPNDVTANVNAASAALSRGDVAYAKRYLDRIKTTPQTPEYYNTTGVLAMLGGDYNTAEEHLKKAASMGSAEAVKNLGEIVRKRENAAQIEEQRLKTKR